MNDNETTTITHSSKTAPKYVEAHNSPLCPICGISSDQPLLYAHNTCSQLCACTAAITEAINGWRLAAMPQWTLS